MFPHYCPFCILDAIQDATLHLLTRVSSNLCQFLILPLFVMIRIVLNSTGQVLWRMYHVLFVRHRSQCNRKSPKGNPNIHWKFCSSLLLEGSCKSRNSFTYVGDLGARETRRTGIKGEEGFFYSSSQQIFHHVPFVMWHGHRNGITTTSLV